MIRATYLAGELLCSASNMVQLSAILCQINKGNYSNYKSVQMLIAVHSSTCMTNAESVCM